MTLPRCRVVSRHGNRTVATDAFGGFKAIEAPFSPGSEPGRHGRAQRLALGCGTTRQAKTDRFAGQILEQDPAQKMRREAKSPRVIFGAHRLMELGPCVRAPTPS